MKTHEKLAKMRKDAKLSRRELAEISGFNIATFSVRGNCIYELIKAPKEYEKLIAQYRINLAKKRKIRKEFLSA